MRQLTEKFRPPNLAAVCGQPAVVRDMRAWLSDPYSVAFLFTGETGTGKSTTGLALAAELGCGDGELGGVFEIASGEMDAESVRHVQHQLRFRPMTGSGWRVIVCNECDQMSHKASVVWLDVLEHLPQRCVVVFTTNDASGLPQRFRDRCECYQFEGRAAVLMPSVLDYCKRIWSVECPGVPFTAQRLGITGLGGGSASFRLAVQQLVPMIRQAKGVMA